MKRLRRILIIDDDVQLLSGMARLFGERDWIVDIATSLDGVSTTELGNSDEKPDVVLCDWDFGMQDTRTGDEVIEILHDRWGDDARYIIWSGLRRDVPEYVEFWTKAGLTELIESVDNNEPEAP